MTNKNYQAGSAFEREVKKVLEASGYFVIKSAGSKSPVDLLCVMDGKAAGVQCKRYGAISKGDEVCLRDLAKQYGFTPYLAYRPKKYAQIVIAPVGS